MAPDAATRAARAKRRAIGSARRGAGLLVCIFVMLMTTLVLVAVFETMTVEMAALRNTLDHERSMYLAEAAVYEALTHLEADPSWRAGIASTQFPAGSGNTYSATAVDGSGSSVVVTGSGTSGAVTRKLQVTVDTGG